MSNIKGTIQFRQFQATLKRLGCKWPEELEENMFAYADEDSNGGNYFIWFPSTYKFMNFELISI